MAHDRPFVEPEDDVDAVSPKPQTFVEPVARRPRRLHDTERIDDRALRRRALEREPQENGLVRIKPAVPDDAPGRTLIETPVSGVARHDHAGTLGCSDLGRERATVECVEADAPPPPAEERDGDYEDQTALQRGRCRREEQQRRRGTGRIREGKAEAKCAGECVHWIAPRELQGATSPLSCSSRAGPIPGTASSSSTEEKPPCCCR